ncbi:MAG: RNA 2',3'-cyclic phosphodiesterase, partial [Rhodocyclaceae bacterium]|nr:RNA 2',3'-cyclic phosphodiesterase [Rhodocyclaceae bacterium]
TLHLTLAFVGEMADDRLPDLLSAAGAVEGERFALILDRLGWWRHNRILWAGCGDTPAALSSLADGLAGRLREAGFPVERRPFAAHLTLLRNCLCERPPNLEEPVAWPAEEFVLVRSRLSDAGSRYEILGRWPLAGGAAPGMP